MALNIVGIVNIFAGSLFLLCTAMAYMAAILLLAELAETYPRQTRQTLRITNTAVLVIYGIMGVPFISDIYWIPVIAGAAAHASYFAVIRQFPEVRIMSRHCGIAAAMLICNIAAWYYQFRIASKAIISSSYYYENRWQYSNVELIPFIFVTTLLVPLAVLLSSSLTETTLPTNLNGCDTESDKSLKGSRRKVGIVTKIAQMIGIKQSATTILPDRAYADGSIAHMHGEAETEFRATDVGQQIPYWPQGSRIGSSFDQDPSSASFLRAAQLSLHNRAVSAHKQATDRINIPPPKFMNAKQ